MTNPFVLGIVAVAVSAQAPDAASFGRCRAASKSMGGCHWRRGRFQVGNGAYSSRIGFVRGEPTGIAVHQPGEDGPDEYAPTAVGAILSRSPNLWAVDGDYLVCSLKQPRGDYFHRAYRLKIACVAGAKRLVARRLNRD